MIVSLAFMMSVAMTTSFLAAYHAWMLRRELRMFREAARRATEEEEEATLHWHWFRR